MRKITISIFAAAILLMGIGVWRNEAAVVLSKGINICLELSLIHIWYELCGYLRYADGNRCYLANLYLSARTKRTGLPPDHRIHSGYRSSGTDGRVYPPKVHEIAV